MMVVVIVKKGELGSRRCLSSHDWPVMMGLCSSVTARLSILSTVFVFTGPIKAGRIQLN